MAVSNPGADKLCRVCVTLVVLCAAAAAQTGAINGFVRDATSGEPLGFANVYLDGTDLGTASAEKGYYYIGRVPPGRQTLKASYVGYEDWQSSVVAAAYQTVTVDILLKPARVQLGEVKVTAARARFEREVEVSAVRLDTRQILSIPRVGGEVDLFRTVQLLPGVVTTSDFSNRLYIRGGSPDQNLVLLDGITVYNPSHLFGLFSPFIPEAVSDVTLLAGGFPAKYGTRLSSVLDVTTKEGNSKRFTADASASVIAAKAQVEGPIPNGSFLVAARRTYLPDVLLDIFGVEGVGYHFYDVIGKVNYDLSHDTKLTLAGLSAEDVLRFRDPTNPEALDARLNWGNRGVALHVNSIFTPILYGEAMLAWSDFYSNFGVSFIQTDTAEFETGLTDLALKADLTWFPADGHDVDFGFDGRWSRVNVSFEFDTMGFARADSLWPLGVYIDEKWEAVPQRLFIKPGLRLAYYTKGSRFSPEPRLGVKYRVEENTTLNAAFGRFSQPMVTLNSTDAVFSIYDVWAPVPAGRPLPVAWHCVGGVERWLRRDAMAQVEVYWKDYANLLETRYGEFFTQPDSLLAADGYSLGADLLLRKTEGRVTGWLSYSFAYARRSIAGEGYFPHYDRRHNANLVLSLPQVFWKMDLSARWALGTGLPYSGVIGFYRRYQERPGQPEPQEPAWGFINGPRDAFRYPLYHRLDVGATRGWDFRWGRVEAFLDVTNVYYASNVLLYYYEVGEDGLPERKQISQLPILPTLGVKVKF
ncbi:MAG: TonB-dependent receptor [bacterium]